MTDCIANWTMILQYLGVLMAWPAVALYLGTAILIRYHKWIVEFLSRLQHGEVGPFKFDVRPQESIKTTEETKLEAIRNVAVALAGQEIKAEAGAIGIAGAAPTVVVSGAQATANELTNCRGALEVAALWLHFERSLNAIFGTQLDFLKALRMRLDGIGAVEVIAVFHGQHQRALQQFAVPFELWIRWLVTIGFIQEVAPGSASWKLTNQGTQFFTYTDQHYRGGLPFRVG